MKLKEIFSNPLIGFTGSVCSVIGIPIAILLTHLSIKEPKITYAIHPVPASIVSPDRNSAIKVLYNNEEVTGAVSSTAIAVWNAGHQPIKSEDILKPVKIKVAEGVKIYEAWIRSSTRDVTNLSLDTSNLQSGEIGINWAILERGDGGIIQVTYNSEKEIDFTFSGIVIGQQELKRFEYKRKNVVVKHSISGNARIQIILGFAMLFLGIFLSAVVFIEIREIARRDPGFRFRKLFFDPASLIILAMTISALWAGGCYLYVGSSTFVPFEF